MPWHKDYRRMFDKIEKESDLVIVCGVTNFLYAAAMHAIERGKHLSITKPMCVTIEEARNLAKAVEKHNIVAHRHGSYTAASSYKNLVGSGVFGEVTMVHFNPAGGGAFRMAPYPGEQGKAPDDLDRDVWTCVSPERPFCNQAFAQDWPWPTNLR